MRENEWFHAEAALSLHSLEHNSSKSYPAILVELCKMRAFQSRHDLQRARAPKSESQMSTNASSRSRRTLLTALLFLASPSAPLGLFQRFANARSASIELVSRSLA